MEAKIKKPATNIFRLLLLLICATTLVLTPFICLYSYFHNYQPAGVGRTDRSGFIGVGHGSDGNEPATASHHNFSWSGGSEEGFLESISSGPNGGRNGTKLRRELIYIYKLPPVRDQDYEEEELAFQASPSGVFFFDDLDTDDYLTDERKAPTQNKLPHRFSQSHKPKNEGEVDGSKNGNQNRGRKNDSVPTLPKKVYVHDDSTAGNSSQQPLPLPVPTNNSNNNTKGNFSLPSTNVQKKRNGESWRRKYYNTGHFRKSHAIIWDPHPQYIFHAFGHRFHLMLNLIPQKHSMFTPQFGITTHSDSGWESGGVAGNDSFVLRENLKGRISGCFYNGFVLGDPQSSVAVSLCHGMTGHIRTSHGSYFIEPLSPTSPDYEKEKGVASQNWSNGTAGGQDGNNDEQQILHEIYQVGLDLPTDQGTATKEKAKEQGEENRENNANADYSYESLDDNLQIGASSSLPVYEDEDEEDAFWLRPGLTTNNNKPIKQKADSQKPKSRKKRWSNSEERFVELSVVTDSSMSAYHKDNLRHYVLTLLSIVAQIYKDASIGNPINIALVSFHILPDKSFGSNKWTLENGTSAESLPGISASDMLRNFCKWQKDHNVLDDKSPHHHDTALLLTRETICRNPWLHKCDTLGLAELGTMCDHYASCAIVQDNGLSAAFTIAHELGHVMNMPHDDDYKCQSFLESQNIHPGSANHIHQQFSSDSPSADSQHFVMSRMLDHNTYPWAWSRCSRHFLTEFLDAGHGDCLEDKPASNLLIGDGSNDHPDARNFLDNFTSPQQPGEIFSENKQCELVFGPSSKLCSYMPSCKRLWCTTGTATEEQEGCRTQHMPWADGTPCGGGGSHWCQRGACVKRDLEKLRTVNGGWGPWLEFGACSRTCGGGVRKSYRECDNPRPSNGGKYCIGPRVRYDSCNTHECPNEVDFRAEQCSNFNNDNFNIQGLPNNITWVPKYHGISPKDRCKLFCRVQHSSSYYLLREKVVDGTPCAPDTFDVCVNGVCLPAGCDRRLHSQKILDLCGVCGGTNSTCRKTRGSFNYTRYGYNAIITIPAGASNILIEQRSFDETARDDNYLALKDRQGNFLLNGNFVVSMFRKTMHHGGSIIEYSGSDAVTERINSSSRPIKTDLELLVLSVGKLNPPDITYEYIISLNYQADVGRGNSNYEEARWINVGDRWTTCSEKCQGSQRQVQSCTNGRSGAEISPEYCRNSAKPQPVVKACNTHCTLKWVRVQRECNCKNPDRTEVSVKCVTETAANTTYVPDGLCSRYEKPSQAPDCEEECSRPMWRTTHWSDCNAVCGESVQTRRVWCQRYRNHTYMDVPDSECRDRKPPASKECYAGACGKWHIADWTPCSATCGFGIRKAIYGCYVGEFPSATQDYCKHLQKPPLEQECEASVPCADWVIKGEGSNLIASFRDDEYWSECSDRCNPTVGTRARPVVCALKHGNRVQSTRFSKQVNDTVCQKVQKQKPLTVKPCDARIPEDCREELERQRMHQRRLQEEIASRQAQAQRQSQSVSFSDIFRGGRRKVEASVISLPLIADNSISGDSSPSDWMTGPWSSCRKSGTNALQSRQVSCPNDQCHGPRPMNSRACGVWFTGEWGNCNSTCETRFGYETREVRCVQSAGERESPYSEELLEESDCLNPKPDSVRSCTSYCRAKGRWRTGPWGKCSRPCGVVQSAGSNITRGSRLRQVVCVDEAKPSSQLPEAECDSRSKPETSSACTDTENQPCPVWFVSEWSECMATSTTVPTAANPKLQTRRLGKSPPKKKSLDTVCSNEIHQDAWGHRERTVHCQDHNGHEIPEYHCRILNRRPEHSELCILSKKHCAQGSPYRWRVSHWTSCSKHCGTKGVKTRTVECTKPTIVGKHNTTVVVDDKFCLKGGKKKKPKGERGCARFHCPFKWVTTEWSECSRTCGNGIQRRDVTCHRVNRFGWVDPDPVNGCENMEKPKEYNHCMISESCEPNARVYAWKTEDWGPCPPPSQYCGQKELGKKAVQRRKVYCTLNGVRTPQRHCEKLGPKPTRRRKCPRVPCGWKSCQEVQEAGNYVDGEFQVVVGGFNMSIYCHGLTTSNPKEYLTLWEEGISEIYAKRLIRPDTCPRNGRRMDSCECVQDRNRRSGLTTWNKIRINVTNLRVDTDDFTFAKSTGDFIAFGTSGDCYSSSMNCPQGRFRIDLRRTNLAVSAQTTWVSQGLKPAMQISKASDNQKVEGKCGGYCGACSPDRTTGLKLDVFQ